VGRTQPDSAYFRRFPLFPGEGMQFESHLGHVFSLFRGLWAAERVQISFMGPCGGPILLVPAGLAAPTLGLDSGVAVYFFMAGSVWYCMTSCELGLNSQRQPCRVLRAGYMGSPDTCICIRFLAAPLRADGVAVGTGLRVADLAGGGRLVGAGQVGLERADESAIGRPGRDEIGRPCL
jgi:hypothetical protein